VIYRLAFGITGDGYLRVTGSAKGALDAAALYLNDQVFAATVKTAGMAPFQTLRLLEAARQARLEPNLDVCCEAVELTQNQIDALCLRPGKDKIA
jgi:hypothetical protein